MTTATQTQAVPTPSPDNHHSHDQSAHSHGSATSATTQASLTVSGQALAQQPVTLHIQIQDEQGAEIAQFDQFQEQLMHLIAVSQDLQVFQHLHPTYKGNGHFQIQTQFPQAGTYTLFSDYQPTGRSEQVSVLQTQVHGQPAPQPTINWSRTKTFGQTIVGFAPNQTTITAGETVTLRFNLQDATTQQPVQDLQPYLGEQGHLVILRQSPRLSKQDYIHAHAVPTTAPSQVHFATRFPQPGNYKLWGQFNRNGQIITADYWVKVL